MRIDISAYLAQAKKYIESGGATKLPAGEYGRLTVTGVKTNEEYGTVSFAIKDGTGKENGVAYMQVSPYAENEKRAEFSMQWLANLAAASGRVRASNTDQFVGAEFAGAVKYKTWTNENGEQRESCTVYVNGYAEDMNNDVTAESDNSILDRKPEAKATAPAKKSEPEIEDIDIPF